MPPPRGDLDRGARLLSDVASHAPRLAEPEVAGGHVGAAGKGDRRPVGHVTDLKIAGDVDRAGVGGAGDAFEADATRPGDAICVGAGGAVVEEVDPRAVVDRSRPQRAAAIDPQDAALKVPGARMRVRGVGDDQGAAVGPVDVAGPRDLPGEGQRGIAVGPDRATGGVDDEITAERLALIGVEQAAEVGQRDRVGGVAEGGIVGPGDQPAADGQAATEGVPVAVAIAKAKLGTASATA